MEALGHMCLLKDKEKAEEVKGHVDRYIHFLSLVRSHPPQSKEDQQKQQEFMKTLEAKLPQPPVPKFEWDFEAIKRRTAKQNAKLQKGG